MIGNYGTQFNSGPNTTVNNANYQHKQRQLSYSPNMTTAKNIHKTSAVGQSNQSLQGGKKRGTSEVNKNVNNLMNHGIDQVHLN